MLLGGTIPTLMPYLDWRHALLGATLIFLIRPAAGMLSLVGCDLSLRQRGVVAFYGVRGIGSIYYLCYAGRHMEFVNESQLWALVGLAILMSTILHGFTVGRAMDKVSDEPS